MNIIDHHLSNSTYFEKYETNSLINLNLLVHLLKNVQKDTYICRNSQIKNTYIMRQKNF